MFHIIISQYSVVSFHSRDYRSMTDAIQKAAVKTKHATTPRGMKRQDASTNLTVVPKVGEGT